MLKLNTLYNTDCMTFLDQIDDNSIDLVLVDPPYNMAKADWDSFTDHQAFLDFTYQWIDKVILKLNETGSLYIFNTPFNSAFICQYLYTKGMIFQNWITWDKRDGMGNVKTKFAHGQETILFFTKNKKHTFNADAVRVPYDSTSRMQSAKTKGILKNGKRWFPNENGKLCPEVWHITSHRHKNKKNGKVVKMGHITPKPHDLIARIINASSNPNDIVLDCFMGSGTTAIVAKKLGRQYIGCEQNPEYFNLAIQQLNQISTKTKNECQ